jgi:hypothetical protein
MGLWFVREKIVSDASYCENSLEMLYFLKKMTSKPNIESSAYLREQAPLLSHCCINGKYWDNMNSSVRSKLMNS